MHSDEQLELLARTTLVIVADSIILDASAIHVLSKDIDRTERRHVDELVAAIRPLIKDVIVYKSPAAFTEAVSLHKDDLVLPDWSGQDSWSRSGLVPAVCESYGLAYIGGDAYTKIVCQDKFLSKTLCAHVGLPTPSAIFVDVPEKLDSLEQCSLPCVVKPCYEGSSIGVDDRSLVYSADQARSRALELLEALKAPILIEAFCPGREISICLLGNRDSVSLLEAGERFIPDDESFFERNVFSFQLKKNSKRTALRLATSDVPEIYFDQAKRLFKLLHKVEILRVDGRLYGNQFQVIELTPDTHLGARAEYAGTFIRSGMTYTDVIAAMILNSRGLRPHQVANKQTSAGSIRISS